MSNHHSSLIVEDERGISDFIATVLTANDYSVLKARDGQTALSLIPSHCPDLVLLDLGLPDMDGLAILRSVREWSTVPILVLSARDHEREKVEALDAGADDYITKPFGISELLARIRTALRHARSAAGSSLAPSGVFTCGELSIDHGRRRVKISGREVHVTQIEFKILALLSQYAGRVLSYDTIIKHVWGPHAQGNNQILRVNMANIRRKIEANPAEPVYILTDVGVGYRMVDNESM